MKVKQLQIDSFRRIKNLTLDFDLKEPTVFLGVNGSGKSSILDCLAILLSWFNNFVQNPGEEGDEFSDSDINNKSQETKNKITVCINSSEDYSWSLERKRNDWSKKEKDVQTLNIVRELLEKGLNNYKNKKVGFLPIAIYYPSKRFVVDIPLETRDKK